MSDKLCDECQMPMVKRGDSWHCPSCDNITLFSEDESNQDEESQVTLFSEDGDSHEE